ncbi:MAG: hypothetical protein KAS87_06320 [Candidatus Omnitrophica bacterium]|nr:hypothetical protein [Candidatus Omnitrophota bacterium]
MTEQKVKRIKRMGQEIAREFGKYGFAPFKIEEVSMRDIEKSVLQIVADELFKMASDIVRFADKETERITEENRKYTHRNIGNGINAVLLHEITFTNDCTIKGRGVNVGIEYYRDDEHKMSSSDLPYERARITIIEKYGSEIFFAKCRYQWDDNINPETLRISTDPKAKSAFQLLQEKHKKI